MLTNKTLQFLAISGSLRNVSSNTALLRAIAELAPAHIKITLDTSAAHLPYFNPDLDTDNAPPAVTDFRARLQQADAVLICSPEYAHGVPGVLKNALDWIVSSGEFMHKPVVLLNTSLSSHHAQDSLTETLIVMMAKVRAVRVPLPNNRVTEAELVANREIASALRDILAQLERAATTPHE